jgi:transcriptional regulator with XRE-family HTH domain
MITQDHRYRRLVDVFADWLKHRRELRELSTIDHSDFDRIALDLRVSPGELDALVQRGPHAADELPKLLQALGVDEAALVRTEPMVLRDMERVCALCGHKPRCDRDLAAGTSAEQYEGYCPNASTIHDLDQPLKEANAKRG